MKFEQWMVWERHGSWAAVAKQQLNDPQLAPREIRSLADLVEQLNAEPRSLVVVETSTLGTAVVARQMLATQQQYPSLQWLAVAQPDEALLLREAGAGDVLRSLVDMERLVALVRTQVRPRPTPWQQSAWNRLPWSDSPS